ncbi:MAG: isochorismatase family protein [Acidimicrobiales bacterium]
MGDTVDFAPGQALVVVDMQNDFADPGGSLFVAGGDDIVEPINVLIASARAGGATVVLTQDWHPPATPHFIDDGGVWPVHCVRSTWGAALHPDLSNDADAIIRKGTGGEDGYSAFAMADPLTGDASTTGLEALLRARAVTRVVVVGLAADVCVKATALDAVAAGFDTTVIWRATRPVEITAGDGARARAELEAAGVEVVE